MSQSFSSRLWSAMCLFAMSGKLPDSLKKLATRFKIHLAFWTLFFQINCGETSVNDNYRLAHYRSVWSTKINVSFLFFFWINSQILPNNKSLSNILQKNNWVYCSTAPAPSLCTEVDPENPLCQVLGRHSLRLDSQPGALPRYNYVQPKVSGGFPPSQVPQPLRW